MCLPSAASWAVFPTFVGVFLVHTILPVKALCLPHTRGVCVKSVRCEYRVSVLIQEKSPVKEIFTGDQFLLVAGKGFEPMTFGL